MMRVVMDKDRNKGLMSYYLLEITEKGGVTTGGYKKAVLGTDTKDIESVVEVIKVIKTKSVDITDKPKQ